MSQHSFTGDPVPIQADLVIRAGNIYSVAPDRTRFQAIALRDEWIIATSPDPHGLDGLITSQTRVLF